MNRIRARNVHTVSYRVRIMVLVYVYGTGYKLSRGHLDCQVLRPQYLNPALVSLEGKLVPTLFL